MYCQIGKGGELTGIAQVWHNELPKQLGELNKGSQGAMIAGIVFFVIGLVVMILFVVYAFRLESQFEAILDGIMI